MLKSIDLRLGFRTDPLLSHPLLVSLFINLPFEVKFITPKWSTNRFPTIVRNTSNSTIAHSISTEIIKNNKAARLLERLYYLSLRSLLMHQPYQDRMEQSYVAPALARGDQSYQTLSHSELHCPAKLQGDVMRAQGQ